MSKSEAERACRQENGHGDNCINVYDYGCDHDHGDDHNCGNNHKHECSHGHKHECGHGHEHGSGHGHEHECSHGHEHGSGHGHKHECGHGHEHGGNHNHKHSHDHHHHTEEIPSVSVYTHDMAVVGSVRCKIGGNYETALNHLQSCMEQAARAVESAGGLIGHVKAYAKEEARSCMISITEGEDIQKKDACKSGIYVECASIVFGVTTETLEKILREAFADYLA